MAWKFFTSSGELKIDEQDSAAIHDSDFTQDAGFIVGTGSGTFEEQSSSEAIETLLSSALTENVSIQLDPVLSADGKYSGITETGTAGATLAFGDLCYLAVADSRWELADSSAPATSIGKLGICVLVATSDGDATKMLTYGKVKAATFPTMTVAAPVFISETAGDVTSTAPTTSNAVVRIIGQANTTGSLFFNPDCSYGELVQEENYESV